MCCFARVQDLEIVDQAVWALQNLLSYQAKAYGWHSSIYRLTVVRKTGMLMSPSVLTKGSVTTEPRGTLSMAPIIWNLMDWNGSRRKVSFLQILQSLGEGSKPQRRERGMFYRRCDCRTTALPVPGSRTQHKSLWYWYRTHGEPLGTHKSDPACRSDLQTLDAAGVTAGASAPPGSAFCTSVSAAETCRSHRGLGAVV